MHRIEITNNYGNARFFGENAKSGTACRLVVADNLDSSFALWRNGLHPMIKLANRWLVGICLTRHQPDLSDSYETK
jgi:hypothetical protein